MQAYDPLADAHARWLIDAMTHAAREAAAYIRTRAGDLGTLEWRNKSAVDFVSDVDTGAEERIRDALLAAARELGVPARVLGEELSPEGAIAADDGMLFIVDPLDGTTNFLHGYPWYAVSIGALAAGAGPDPVAGVVLNVPTGETFTAALGRGAFRNGHRIAVSSTTEPARALIGTGFPFKKLEELEQYRAQFSRVARETSGMRRAGAAALDLCDVACGRFDGFWELNLMPWDMAAGIVIIREAGGVVTDLAGARRHPAQGALVAGNPEMHAWLLDTLTAP